MTRSTGISGKMSAAIRDFKPEHRHRRANVRIAAPAARREQPRHHGFSVVYASE